MTQSPWRDAKTLKTYCDAVITDIQAARKDLKAPGRAPTVNEVLDPFNRIQMALETAAGWASVGFSLHPDKDVRDVAQECRQALSELENELSQDRTLYDTLAAVDLTGTDAQTKRFTEHTLRDFRRSGVDKDDATRKRLADVHAEITRLSQEFKKRLLEDVNAIQITDATKLEGMPADWIAEHAPNKDGVITVTTDYPDFIPFQKYCRDGALRKKLYQAFLTRGYPENGDTLKQILTLRHEYAALLDHPSWASYNAEDKMAKNTETIERFIKELTEIVRPQAKEDLALLLKRKQKDDPNATRVETWDRFYYISKVREEEADFDAKKLRPYLAYNKVKKGILDLYAQLFELTFVPLEDEPVWHPAVEAWEMQSEGKRIGIFYMDMHPRDGKYKHAAMFGIQTGLAGIRIPRASLVCNFPNPQKDGKGLMEHAQVTTFFHEFGHLVHHMLAQKSKWVTLAGINVEWDFVEAPSQILEEWAWDAEVLGRFAHHVDTGKVIPPELVKKLRASEEFGKGINLMRQVHYTAYSYYLHAEDPKTLDLEAFTNRIQAGYSPYPRIDGTYMYASFGHLIGYSSMYYTYQWSLVIAKDLFTRFKARGLLDPKVAAEYREHILAPGGTRDAADLVSEFLGRPYNFKAYKAWLEH